MIRLITAAIVWGVVGMTMIETNPSYLVWGAVMAVACLPILFHIFDVD